MKKIIILAALITASFAANAQCSGKSAAAGKSCCTKKVSEGTTSTTSADLAAKPVALEASPKAAKCCAGKKACDKKAEGTADAKVEEIATPMVVAPTSVD
jgi:hypothetical protein